MKNIIIIAAVILVSGILLIRPYNKLVTKDEGVKNAWAKVQTQYQRRADLFLNQMEVVKGAAKNEKEILEGVTKARAGITEAQEKMKTASTPQELDNYMNDARQAAMNFKIQVEAYPTVRSTEAFLNFQAEIAGTENRVSVVRNDYNDVVQDFNTTVRKFPTNIFASIFGMSVKPLFEAESSSQKAPKISF
ncbi:MAG TPA: LemA family protein [Chitinophagaceae bacterium]|nr:MAG: LemA family protein [Bacteroidetes bacterium OLB11]HMN32825.1 LemA family protein [Chitinophagaceae bacterium]